MTDVHLGERVTQALNFGFRGARESEIANINGKLSEYHAAVGLAELDGWPDKLARLTRVVEGYRQAFAQRVCAGHPVALPDISTSYFLWSCRNSSESTRIHASLRRSDRLYRLWLGHGLHRQPAFATSLHESLDVTDNIAPTLVGLPRSSHRSLTRVDGRCRRSDRTRCTSRAARQTRMRLGLQQPYLFPYVGYYQLVFQWIALSPTTM